LYEPPLELAAGVLLLVPEDGDFVDVEKPPEPVRVLGTLLLPLEPPLKLDLLELLVVRLKELLLLPPCDAAAALTGAAPSSTAASVIAAILRNQTFVFILTFLSLLSTIRHHYIRTMTAKVADLRAQPAGGADAAILSAAAGKMRRDRQ
jgi:hypothetical protein